MSKSAAVVPATKAVATKPANKASLYEMRRAHLSGEDLSKLLQGECVWVGNTSFIYDGSNPQLVDSGVLALKKNIAEGQPADSKLTKKPTGGKVK